MNVIWIVTEWYPKQNREPIVTAFDNRQAAEKYGLYITSHAPQHTRCVVIDKAPIHSAFKIYSPEE